MALHLRFRFFHLSKVQASFRTRQTAWNKIVHTSTYDFHKYSTTYERLDTVQYMHSSQAICGTNPLKAIEIRLLWARSYAFGQLAPEHGISKWKTVLWGEGSCRIAFLICFYVIENTDHLRKQSRKSFILVNLLQWTENPTINLLSTNVLRYHSYHDNWKINKSFHDSSLKYASNGVSGYSTFSRSRPSPPVISRFQTGKGDWIIQKISHYLCKYLEMALRQRYQQPWTMSHEQSEIIITYI